MVKKAKAWFILILQRLWITADLYSMNGLSNHAAAGAYGFLLSSAPALLMVSFFLSRAIASSPEAVAELIQQTGFLQGKFDIPGLIKTFLASSHPGVTGIISAVSILWTARICALSIQRGLGVIFPNSKKTSPIRFFAAPAGLEFLIILFIFITVLSSRIAIVFYNSLEFVPISFTLSALTEFTVRTIPFFCLALMTLAAYRLIPPVPPAFKDAFKGMIFCVVLFRLFSLGFRLIINPARYNLIYGALGSLLLLLVNVYFFFIFFFLGAQLTYVIHSFDALLFIRFRKFHSFSSSAKTNGIKLAEQKLFASHKGLLGKKYFKKYKEGEIILSKEKNGNEVYYVLQGEAGVFLDKELKHKIAVIKSGEFFGEMEHILKDDSQTGPNAIITADTDLSALALPPGLFSLIMKTDPETDRKLIKLLSKRLQNANQLVIRGEGVNTLNQEP
ncbi:YhjD/YihY/BrkB family envelope integrity protein [Leadbettera azotonutricia]|uniref:Putative membrane protein n=1 Tax=Leadbettera azotonutricia (strain ATCC BAA-888 / DSM 13862 / ZAS-9) TaxID=545695 RepID=F5YAC6_LEAAZ|nr:YhjD/YihY/BrkB family envelope integrity protein [Leadbettera azotonutricia]AEF82237.1 putative membrane protein [Leadbettera azotonutricia ZAS-9]